mmetsp:Transcript_20088/g.16581  ORF Transcript_20088/g.16581 Transcript_20088/m.16581 type:complete len:88 (-) Transcript_20088:566-829(-)
MASSGSVQFSAGHLEFVARVMSGQVFSCRCFFDRTTVYDINSLVGVAYKWDVDRVKGVSCVCKFSQVDLTCVQVTQSVHYSFYLAFR